MNGETVTNLPPGSAGSMFMTEGKLFVLRLQYFCKNVLFYPVSASLTDKTNVVYRQCTGLSLLNDWAFIGHLWTFKTMLVA